LSVSSVKHAGSARANLPSPARKEDEERDEKRLSKADRTARPTISDFLNSIGQTLPSPDFCGTAALPLKPDIAQRGWHGRKVPKGDIRIAAMAALFDHLVGEREQSVGNLEAKCLRGLEIDD
jgi:hypothetical protein